MKIQLKVLAATAALITGIIFGQAVYAEGTSKSPVSMMEQNGMMRGGQNGQIGRGGMMNMMGMMGHMNKMMQTMMRHQQEKIQKPAQPLKKNKK